MLGDLVRAFLERALEAELTGAPGYAKAERRRARAAQTPLPHGVNPKTLQTASGRCPCRSRSDGAGSFEAAAGAQAGRAGLGAGWTT